jgi:hypothetical protein
MRRHDDRQRHAIDYFSRYRTVVQGKRSMHMIRYCHLLLIVAIYASAIACGRTAWSDATPPAESTATPGVIRATEFQLVDKSGNVTAKISNGEDGGSPSVQLFDSTGKMRISIAVQSGARPDISLYNNKGNETAALAYDIKKDATVLYMFDSAGTERCAFGIVAADSPVAAVYYKSGELAASMEVDDELGNISVANAKNSVDLFAKPNGDAGLSIMDTKGDPSALLGTVEGAFPIFSLLAGKNKQSISLSAIPDSSFLALTDDSGTVRSRLTALHDGSAALTFADKQGKVVKTVAP